jgi:hypothetical protein
MGNSELVKWGLILAAAIHRQPKNAFIADAADSG